ncbi:MAG: nuclear transport factor 2 family protein [Gemmatimonadota bacterium]|nr:nuclear transport factor 2 family protein [Gemmatimonadota bacterium]
MRVVRITALLLAGALIGSRGQAQSKSPDDAAVRAVVERYPHGLKFNDVESFRVAFWPDAKLMFIKRDGTLGRLTQTDWYTGFEKVAGKEEQGDLRIDALDISGNAASVKVTEVYPKEVYIDYLNLLRIGSEWRIVNKIYTSHPQ